MLSVRSISNLLFSGVKRGADFIFFVARHLQRDHCAQTAASLTYTSLLALVPLLIVGFSILRVFPLFPELLGTLQSSILQVFTPDAGQAVKQYIQDIINKGSSLPKLSLFVLVITAVMLLYTIDDILNRIWRVNYQRRTRVSFAIYFVVVLSGPLLLGGSLVITTYLVSRSWATQGVMEVNWLVSVPWLVTLIAFTSLYRWVPNTHVAWKHAVSGGVVAMILFELAKWGFTLYLRWVPMYGLLYGTLAAIPLTLVWIYLCWLVVLVGAETARCLAVYAPDYRRVDISSGQLLGVFFMHDKEGISIDQAVAWVPLGKRRLRWMFDRLQGLGLVQNLTDGRVALTDKALAMSIVKLRVELTEQLKLIEGTSKNTLKPRWRR